VAGGVARWLLIGNSRWHWAEGGAGSLHHWSEAPGDLPATPPVRWAAVGPVPAGLDPATRLDLAQVPLAAAPPWLGVDRALAGHEAWRRSGTAVLVADAGTALSLTLVDDLGRFAGGRLAAGAALQLRALHQGTCALPAPAALEGGAEPWPSPTEEAMVVGVLEALAGALERAARQARRDQPGCRLWLTGGDAERLLPLLQADQAAGGGTGGWTWAPGLCLDGLVRLAGLS
jgi:type III pantothenate kinase